MTRTAALSRGDAGGTGVAEPPDRASIVVIEDEAAIASAVAARLRSAGFGAQIATDGPSGVELVERARPDLVVLDLMLPGLDGLEVCRRIQRERRVPVVMLTARDDEQDVLTGFETGADDYITKPFSPRELVARVQAVLRRAATATAAAVGSGRPADAVLHLDDLEIDREARRVRRAGREVHLTATEFDLLVSLAGRPGVVRSREELLADVWGYRDGYGARTVDSHVRAVRRKLGADVIRTVHSVGYAIGVGPGGRAGDGPDRSAGA